MFPPADLADENGLLAVGGDLRPERLVLAYSQGIFPWYQEGLPILWHSPPERFAMEVDELRVGRSLRKALRKAPYQLTLDTDFAGVIRGCAATPRADQDGTWITSEMEAAYLRLHELGFAHSVEARRNGELVGGLYGVCLSGAFFGESMFSRASDASKIAFVTLVRQLQRWSISLIDCQVYTENLERFGASSWSRERFLQRLKEALDAPTRRGRWAFDADLTTAALADSDESRAASVEPSNRQ